MKKLIRHKSFKPCAIDEGEELFPNGIFVFNISKMLAFIKSQPAIFKVEQVAISPRFAKLDSSRLDEATVLKADLTVPIVLAEISPGHFNVIDGNHRVVEVPTLWESLMDSVA